MRPLVQLGSKLSPCSFSFHETCLFLISVSNFCCIYSSPWVVNLAKATLGTAAALFSDPSCAVCCLSPGITQLAHYFIYLFIYFFISGEKDESRTHQATCQQMKWSHDYVAESSTSTQSTLKNLAWLRGQQIKAVTGFIYVSRLIGDVQNWTFTMTKSWWKKIDWSVIHLFRVPRGVQVLTRELIMLQQNHTIGIFLS